MNSLHDLGPDFETTILTATGSSRMDVVEVIQELWSGYGKILRIELDKRSSIIAKHDLLLLLLHIVIVLRLLFFLDQV